MTATEREIDDRVLGSHRRRLRSLALVVGTAFRADPWRAVVVLVLTLIEGLGGIVTAAILKVVTDAVASGDRSHLIRNLSVLSLGLFLVTTANLLAFISRMRLTEATQLLIDQDLIRLSAGIHGLEHHERPDYVDQLSRLRERRGQLAGSVNSISSGARVVMQLVGTVSLLGTVHPVLLLLPLSGVPSFLLEGKAERHRRAVWEATTERFRAANHLFQLAIGAAAGKELRIFGVGGEVVRRHRELRDEVTGETRRAGRRGVLLSAAGWTFFAAGYIAALIFVVLRAIDGDIGPGEVVLVVSLGTQVNELVGGLVGTTTWTLQNLDVVRRWLWLSDIGQAAAARRSGGAPAPTSLTDGIRFHDVSFTYPGTDVAVLEHVDLHIPAGATVAIVGDNGAGKSTLVKLLCRFYEPTAGRITVDGVDLASIDVDEWRSRMAAGFQDFARFEFEALETVGVGDIARIDDEAAVTEALRRAHADDVALGLADGLATQLGKSFEDGHELSGGQWQKLALGRAMMRDDPLLLVLDEPTAAIDAETEHALFERYAGAAQAAAQDRGAITLLVSHRFSTVRMASLIVVVDGGAASEVGDHATLIRRGGLYAELYDLQARGYR